MGGVSGYDQLCCPASPKLLLGLDLGLGCDNMKLMCESSNLNIEIKQVSLARTLHIHSTLIQFTITLMFLDATIG